MDKVRASLLHVIAADRDRIELRHLIGRVFNDIRNDPHRGFRRIDIGVPHHEFFQNVVLNCARQHIARMPLLFPRHDEVGKDRNNRTVHRHRHRDLIEWNTIKEDLHILDAINRYARLADITLNAGVVAVIAPVGRQIEGHRHALLPCSQSLAIERI